jgi:hypothetical protein
MSLNREILIWKERGRGERDRGVGGQVSTQSFLRLGLGQIEGKYRDMGTKRHRKGAENQNPEQSRVAQLVLHNKRFIKITVLYIKGAYHDFGSVNLPIEQ